MRDGLANLTDRTARRAEVLQKAVSGLGESLGGNQVFLDVVHGDRTEQPMRLVFQLFEQTPLAFANFHALCTHSDTGLGESGKQLTYRRSTVHRVVRGRYFEGGDITLGTGTGGDSIYGTLGFEDEAFGLSLRHDAAGWLTMAPDAPNLSRFRVTLGPCPQVDGLAVIIGRLVSGAMHLPALEATPVDAEGRPVRQVSVVECGAIPGFSSLPPPIVAAEPPAPVTLDNVDAAASALRDSVALAVEAALKGNSGAPTDGGCSSTDPKSKSAAGTAGATASLSGAKRTSAGAGGAAPPAKKGGMMTLFIEGMGDDDDDDDDDDDGDI